MPTRAALVPKPTQSRTGHNEPHPPRTSEQIICEAPSRASPRVVRKDLARRVDHLVLRVDGRRRA
eukprot:2950724-Prymnesium_polylepis.1